MADKSANQTAGATQGRQFDIPDFVKEKYPHLIPMILKTESMTDDERQYWFSILPIMTQEQVAKLEEILKNEAEQLKKLDENYTKEMQKINETHMLQWKEFEIREKRKKLQQKEKKAETAEATAEEDLLKKLSDM